MKIATRGNCVGFPSVNKRWLQPCFKGGIKAYLWLEYSFLFQFQTHSIQRCIQLVREQSQFNLWLPWGNCSSRSCPHSNLGYNPWLLEVKIHWSEENSAAGYNDQNDRDNDDSEFHVSQSWTEDAWLGWRIQLNCYRYSRRLQLAVRFGEIVPLAKGRLWHLASLLGTAYYSCRHARRLWALIKESPS